MYTPSELIQLLGAYYGPRPWYARNEPLAELIQTVLSQHTSDLNAERSFKAMWSRFESWEAIAGAEMEELVRSILSGGLARQKGPRIRAILEEVYARRGAYDLAFLKDLPQQEALEWLTSLHGVGPKTARCVLLFALGFPCIPVDTHVHRVAKRLGLIGPKTTADQAHDILEAMVGEEGSYLFHVYLIEHGRKICHAQRPTCPECPLQEGCPSSTMRQAEDAKTAAAVKRQPRPATRRVGSHVGAEE